MRSVVFVNHLPRGSASSYRQEGFAKYLRRAGWATTLVCRGSAVADRGGDGAYTREVHWTEPFPLMLVQNAQLLVRAARGADIVHVNRANPFTATVVSLARGAIRGKLVVDMEDWDGYGGYSTYIRSHGPRGWALTAYERAFPRSADEVVVVSRMLRDYMVGTGVPEERLTVIHNGFDEEVFDPGVPGGPAREEYGIGDNLVVMYSSTFWEFEKRQHELAFSALRQILAEVPEAKVVMTGREDSSIAEALSRSGIAGRAVTPGFVPRGRLPWIMAAADVAVHVIGDDAFHRASSPMIVPEYMAMGKPVVAPRVGELEVILGGGAGVLVDGSEPASIAGAAVRLLRDRGEREAVGGRARMKAVDEFSYRSETKELMRVYERALE
jgi:glycosyltransferase involved in cell wall biosynthesis